MKREIKFRAWLRKRLGNAFARIEPEMFYFDWLEIGTIDNLVNNYEFELMQYTGLKDKNGKEIYEGDILKVPFGKRFRLLEIAWDKDKSWLGTASFWAYCLTEPRTDEAYRLGDQYEIMFENGKVIGNIYENPELLKK